MIIARYIKFNKVVEVAQSADNARWRYAAVSRASTQFNGYLANTETF